jgi:hypothetical protein
MLKGTDLHIFELQLMEKELIAIYEELDLYSDVILEHCPNMYDHLAALINRWIIRREGNAKI